MRKNPRLMLQMLPESDGAYDDSTADVTMNTSAPNIMPSANMSTIVGSSNGMSTMG